MYFYDKRIVAAAIDVESGGRAITSVGLPEGEVYPSAITHKNTVPYNSAKNIM